MHSAPLKYLYLLTDLTALICTSLIRKHMFYFLIIKNDKSSILYPRAGRNEISFINLNEAAFFHIC